jgi:hypothetical protein
MTTLEQISNYLVRHFGDVGAAVLGTAIILAVIVLFVVLQARLILYLQTRQIEGDIMTFLAMHKTDPYYNTKGIYVSSLYSGIYGCEPYEFEPDHPANMLFEKGIRSLISQGKLIRVHNKLYSPENV